MVCPGRAVEGMRHGIADKKRPGSIMINTQKSLLDKRLREHAKKQPEIVKLKKLLLSIAGKHLVAPEMGNRVYDNDVPRLIESGFIMDYPVTERIMEPNACHLNSAVLLATDKATGMCTGYALTDEDGLWRQHSWALRRQKDGTNRIIE